MATPYPVFSDGRIVPGDRPVISAEDQGFLLGLSVFDTLLYEGGCLYFAEDHLERLQRGAAELAIPWPPPWDPLAALHATAAALDGRDAALRLTLSRGVPGRGPSLTVTPRALERPADPGVAVHVASFRKLGGERLEGVKSTNRLRNVLAREEAERAGAWEALFVNHEGDLSEGTVTNLFVVEGGELVTPSEERGCLEGITRKKILADLEREPLALPGIGPVPLVVGRVELERLRGASEVFLTNTTCRVTPVVEVLGLTEPPQGLAGAAGAVVTAVRARLAALERLYREGREEPAGGRR